jgi:hypothetical protein
MQRASPPLLRVLAMRKKRISEDLLKRVATTSFSLNPAKHRVPELGNFSYGPTLSINGVRISGKLITLDQNAENFIGLTFSGKEGSCPYLVSWDGKLQDWVNHGKVLHKGQGKPHEYSETKTFEGFRARFRLEEREPEIAYIDHAELVVALKNGETLALKPDQAKLAARDGNYLELMWGDGAELVFALPQGVAEEDVAESRLTLTGYYERYSNLLASANFSRPTRLKVAPMVPAPK